MRVMLWHRSPTVAGGMSCDFSSTTTASCSTRRRPAATGSPGSTGRRRPGDLILRHDVDLSLEAAVALAEVEAEAGAWSTWFLMTRSVFYNLASAEGERTIARLRELGGRSPTTRSGPTSTSTTASSRSSPGTTPTPST